MGPVAEEIEPTAFQRTDSWNVVVSVRTDGYRRARRCLRAFGAVHTTDYYNVLVLSVADVPQFLEALNRAMADDPDLASCLARVIPVTATFRFQSPEQFEMRAREALTGLAPVLAGKTFYVRMHRRGFRGQLASQGEERALDRFLLDALQQAGTPGHVGFDDPDAVVAIETVGQWAGLSLWQRSDLERYPFIRVN